MSKPVRLTQGTPEHDVVLAYIKILKEREKMDNRFLSRGKRVDNGEWVVGYYVAQYRRGWAENAVDVIFCTGDDGTYIREIDPATLGQCTGLEDKNGKFIFEGDIVRGMGVCGETVTEPVRYSNGEYLPFDYIPSNSLEIIDTIHDTPGELGGEKGGEDVEG